MRILTLSLTAALLALTAFPTFSQAQMKKKVVCTATINSNEEKETFQRYLSTDYFEFVELVKHKTDTDFLARTCRENKVQCDVVLVSGHFGGGFTDNKNFFLSDKDMETLSCKSCPNVLNNATMVYLFGCNTLASKQKDNRSAEEYARVLRDEVGLDSADALATAAVRYSALGDSFNDRLRRIFRGSAFIGGFGSKAPLGNQIEESLGGYFRALAPGITKETVITETEKRMISEAYIKEIDRMAEGKANGKNLEIYNAGQRLQPLFADSVRGHYTDVAGILNGTTEDFVAKQYCSFYESKDAKLRAIEQIVGTNDRSAVVQMLPYLLEMSSRGDRAKQEQKAFLSRLSMNQNLRDVVIGQEGVLSQLGAAPLEFLKTVDLANNLGWISDVDQNSYYRQAAVFVWNHSSGLTKNKDLMKRIEREFPTIQASEIKPTAFEGAGIWDLIQKYHRGDQTWTDLARQNIDLSVKYYVRKYRQAEGEIRDYPLLSKDGVNVRRKKMKDAGKDLSGFCQTAKNSALAPELRTLLATRAQDFQTLDAGKCSKLLN
ncbi:MAG: hypothetical protein EOP05_06555 [Proteobacteria bacterium]|nr:MAG: hypothetical protein EOP05_06555 [Pseudomonadota bacterium]